MAAPNAREQKFAKDRWVKIFQQALDADTWGQTLEASSEYERLLRAIDQSANDLKLTIDQKSLVSKLRHAVSKRLEALQDIKSEKEALKLEDMKKLTEVFEGLFVRPVGKFPVELVGGAPDIPKAATPEDLAEVVINAEQVEEVKEQHKAALPGLLPPPSKMLPGQTTISIYIDKIGLKDAQSLANGRITVSVEEKGEVLEEQSTPESNSKKLHYINFQETVYIQKPFDQFSKDTSIFFEFKHFKQQKNKLSTKCFAFVEYEEIQKAGDACLELYKKPTDFTKKKLSLVTAKMLYLHIRITLHQH
jgi:hypothetical protein